MLNKFKLIPCFELILFILFFIFSFWLMFHTFSYENGSMMIATKAWSDFASHIPLIRSFSYGNNFPPEYPMFPGEPIKYHFLFYALVGLLEKTGLRIDYALNILSSLSFAGLLIMIYLLSKKLFLSKAVGLLSIIFFLFNGSLSFLEFFKTHPFSLNTFNDILKNTAFPSFGPYDGKIVSAFWNLNIYTNQRHLAFSFTIVLLIIYLLYLKLSFKSRKITFLMIAFLISLLFFANQAALATALIWILWIIILKIRHNFFLLLAFPIVFLWFFISPSFLSSTYSISFKPGFLLSPPITFYTFINYWILNLGFYIILIPLGILKSSRFAKFLFVPLIALFVLPNLFQFSPDIINNHKFFNFFFIIGSMFAANFLFTIWKGGKFRKIYFNKFICIVLFIFLTLSGVIDFMAIKNDNRISLSDIPANKDALFIKQNIKPQSIILNSTSLYHPASIAGRPIFFGYSYFSWSYGYDNTKREKIYLRIYRSQTKEEACNLLKKNNIPFIELSPNIESHINPNWILWKNNFKQIYENKLNGLTIYDVYASCL